MTVEALRLVDRQALGAIGLGAGGSLGVMGLTMWLLLRTWPGVDSFFRKWFERRDSDTPAEVVGYALGAREVLFGRLPPIPGTYIWHAAGPDHVPTDDLPQPQAPERKE